jgi:Zn-dependent protease
MNFFDQGIPLGRWFGIRVIIHWLFVAYAGWWIFTSKQPGETGLLMALLFGVVLLHEFGHALSCLAVGGQAERIILWPLGGIAFVQPPPKAWAWLVTTVCGPLVNAVLWPVFYFASMYLIQHHYGPELWIELRNAVSSGGMGVPPSFTVPEKICVLLWEINRILLLFNLIPSYPMDGGRLLQEILWFIIGYGKSMQIAGMVGTVAGASFVVIGLGLQEINIKAIGFRLGEAGHTSPMLVAIGVLCAMQSFGIYKHAQEIKSWRKN